MKLPVNYTLKNITDPEIDTESLARRQSLIHTSVIQTLRNLPVGVRALVRSVRIENNNDHLGFIVTFNLEGTYGSCDPANETWEHPAVASIDFLREDMKKEKVVKIMHAAIHDLLTCRLNLVQQHCREMEHL